MNLPIHIADEEDSLVYTYGAGNNRIKARLFRGGQLVRTTWYGDNFERVVEGSAEKFHHWILSPDGPLALVVTVTGGSTTYYYICRDHLNSITGIMDASGEMLEEYSYDPWGRRRSPEDWLTTDVTAPVITTRGYTGHEHLDAFGLIHMNGRIYDPHLGRILNPDPIIQEPLNIQNYNRYSYCLNNPLKYTDPSGYMSFYKAMNYLLNETEHGGYWEKGGAAVPFRQEDVDFILNGLSVSNGGYGGGGGRSGGGSAYIEEITWGTNNGIALNLSDRSGTSWYFATDGDLEYFVVFNRTVTTPNGASPAGQGGIVGGDLWNSISNNLNGVSYTAAGMAHSGRRALSRTLAYTYTNSLLKPSQIMFKVPGGSVYTSTKFVSGATKALKVGGAVTGVVGVGITAFEIGTGQKNLIGEGGLDLIMGGVAFIPGGGWVVSGLYFGGKILLEHIGYDFWNKP